MTGDAPVGPGDAREGDRVLLLRRWRLIGRSGVTVRVLTVTKRTDEFVWCRSSCWKSDGSPAGYHTAHTRLVEPTERLLALVGRAEATEEEAGLV